MCLLQGKFFESPEQAQNVVNTTLWKKSSSENSSLGCRVEYCCSAGKYRQKDCPAGIYLLYNLFLYI